jgi:hypothetical protein
MPENKIISILKVATSPPASPTDSSSSPKIFGFIANANMDRGADISTQKVFDIINNGKTRKIKNTCHLRLLCYVDSFGFEILGVLELESLGAHG